MAKTLKKIPVSKRALIARINRKLARDGQKLYAWRSPRTRNNLGPYYVVDDYQNKISVNVNLAPYAREIEVMSEWEELAE